MPVPDQTQAGEITMARKNTNQAKSCVPQLFDNAEPGQDWSLDELSNYARIQHCEILDGEKSQVQIYWRLGAALVLAKKAFKHGKWSQHLKELGIERTRASRARAIYQTFPEVEDTAGLTVAEAYDRAGPQATVGRFGRQFLSGAGNSAIAKICPIDRQEGKGLGPDFRGD